MISVRSRALAEQHWAKYLPIYATSQSNLAELTHEAGQNANAEPLNLVAIGLLI